MSTLLDVKNLGISLLAVFMQLASKILEFLSEVSVR